MREVQAAAPAPNKMPSELSFSAPTPPSPTLSLRRGGSVEVPPVQTITNTFWRLRDLVCGADEDLTVSWNDFMFKQSGDEWNSAGAVREDWHVVRMWLLRRFVQPVWSPSVSLICRRAAAYLGRVVRLDTRETPCRHSIGLFQAGAVRRVLQYPRTRPRSGKRPADCPRCSLLSSSRTSRV